MRLSFVLHEKGRNAAACVAVFATLAAMPSLGRSIEVVTIQTPASAEVKPGAGSRLAFNVVVKPGYHVQANPVENPDLIPITLKMGTVGNVSTGEPVYPIAKRMRLAGDSQDLVVYDGTFVIALPIHAGIDAAAGETVTLKGTLHYQACDDRHCLFPVTLPVAVVVTVAKR